VGVLRLSGPLSLPLGLTVARGLPKAPAPRHAYWARFVDGRGQVLDEGLFIYFRAPRSFTGEDVVELQVHGSPALLSMLQAELLGDGRCRLAEPGEFTRRAFLSGRIDLARAEAVADLVGAANESQVRAAAAQAAGQLSEQVRALREPLLALRAEVEGELDFPDEAEPTRGIPERLAESLAQARELARTAAGVSLVRRGARVALFGPVNAGKSTLFNALLGREQALVDAEPGTTRDVLEAPWELDGLTVTLLDTAGLSERAGRLEARGIARAREEVRRADLALLLEPPGTGEEEARRWVEDAAPAKVLRVPCKADLLAGGASLGVSGMTGRGLDSLRRRVAEALWAGAAQGTRAALDRHAELLRRVCDALERAVTAAQHSTLEVVSGEVGLALSALAELTGEDASAALLDAVFRRFCIGK
jgi:tRNA modification GTPase